MSGTYKITTFAGITMNGSSKFTDDKFLNNEDQEISLPSYAGTVATLDGVETLTQKTLTSPTINTPTVSNGSFSNTLISDNKVYSKTTSNTLTLPTTTDTLVARDTTDTLTNKTLTTPVIATIKPTASNSLTLPDTTDTLVARDTTDTLTNKTLTSPIIATIQPSAGKTLTLPNTTDTLVARDTTDELTNKTLKAAKVDYIYPTSGNTTTKLSVPTNMPSDGVIATQKYVDDALDTNDYENDLAYDKLIKVVDRLVYYLNYWIDVGEINMNDIRDVVDTEHILPQTDNCTYSFTRRQRD